MSGCSGGSGVVGGPPGPGPPGPGPPGSGPPGPVPGPPRVFIPPPGPKVLLFSSSSSSSSSSSPPLLLLLLFLLSAPHAWTVFPSDVFLPPRSEASNGTAPEEKNHEPHSGGTERRPLFTDASEPAPPRLTTGWLTCRPRLSGPCWAPLLGPALEALRGPLVPAAGGPDGYRQPLEGEPRQIHLHLQNSGRCRERKESQKMNLLPDAHLSLGGADPPGETGEAGGRPSPPSLEPVLAALLLAHTFSLGGGASTTFSGSLGQLGAYLDSGSLEEEEEEEEERR
ncbi:hypothetical protein EYF80_057093 [Liparis tanakae]|uniref:Uncharacterized protein n=1 Tax=Liparis tanakae TaxID=230148 RepID=A0A4Z2EUX8_9TELE|nr:hypothetical protein EYF80_057093 [Liparis tanakae]